MDFHHDLVTSLSPMYYLSIVVGLAAAKVSGPIGNRIITKGRYHWFYNITYLLIHVFLISVSFYQRLETKDLSKFDPRIVLFGIYTSLFISIVVLICHHLFRNGIQNTMNEIYELDKQMTAFGIRIEHQLVYKSTWGVTSFLVLTAIWFSFIRESTILHQFHYTVLFGIQYLVSMTMKSQFCVYNIALKYRFLALDEKLKEVICSTRNEPVQLNNKIIMVRTVNKENDNSDILSPLAEKIISLSEFHSKLYNICKRINIYFSVQILLITGKYFVEITATLYFNLQKFYRTGSSEDQYDFYAFAHFIWAVMNGIDLLILVYSSDSMCSAANNCKLTLHKVNLNSKDIEMKKEVTAFSLQLLHNDLILTAAGFFSIDFTLIFNIIGAVTSYLVIFIQFDMSANTTMQAATKSPYFSTTYSTLSSVTDLLHFKTVNFTLAP